MTALAAESAAVVNQSKRVVHASDGVQLAVFTYGDFNPTRPTVLAVHGYPDNHHVWDVIASRLVSSHDYNVVAYDVRGAGESSKPAKRSGYSMVQLAKDIDSVIAALPVKNVHLLAHDWGSIQSWTAVNGSGGRYQPSGKISSFTSISGPDLNMAGAFLGEGLTRGKHVSATLRQCVSSTYIPFFLLPVLPELAFSSGIGQKVLGLLGGISGSSVVRSKSDYRNGLNLYRENIVKMISRPLATNTTVPVQLIIPSGDVFVTPPAQLSQAQHIPQVEVNYVHGGHWVVESKPDVIARLTAQFITKLNSASQSGESADSPALAAPLLGSKAKGVDPIKGKLALITGAGSGIGRATALELAKRGIGAVIVVDRDRSGAEETVRLLEKLDTPGYVYQVDVSDQDAIIALAKDVKRDHGVVDILFNNAGIGMAGRFLETSQDAFNNIVNINLLSIIVSCRVFGEQMIERGQGGHILNMASASAFLPSKVMVAYSTTKAAVLGFGESLRPDYADEGIKVSTICPGFVNTNIAKNTVYQGLSPAEEVKARQKADKAYRRRNYTPAKTAKVIVDSLYSSPPVVVISPEAKLLYAMRRLNPGILRLIAKYDIRLT